MYSTDEEKGSWRSRRRQMSELAARCGGGGEKGLVRDFGIANSSFGNEFNFAACTLTK